MGIHRVTLVVALAAVLSLGMVSVSKADLYTPDQGMELTLIAEGGSIVSITGKTIKSTEVLFSVWSPSNNLVKLDQVMPDDNGKFSTDLNVSGLTEDGAYTIVANQGESGLYELKVRVRVVDGVAQDTVTTQSNFEKASSAVSISVFEGGKIELSADALEGSDTIGISGQTDITNLPITLKVVAPNGNVISVNQLSPDLDGLFFSDIMVGGPMWSQDGAYIVTAEQEWDGYAASVSVDIQDGVVVPEFGTVAALVLAASIIAIIAVSARSGLSLVPRVF